MANPLTYFQEVAREIRKVSWPSREQTQNKTLLVIGVSLIVGIYIGVLDYVFQRLITAIL